MGVAEPLYGELTDAMLLDVGQPLDTGELISPGSSRILPARGRPGRGAGHRRPGAGRHRRRDPGRRVLDSRYAGYAFTLPDVVADAPRPPGPGASAQAADGIDLRLVGCVLELGGRVRATAAGAAPSATRPRPWPGWSEALACDRGLAVGDLVLSGGLTEAVAVAPGDVVVARFGRLGTVELAVR